VNVCNMNYVHCIYLTLVVQVGQLVHWVSFVCLSVCLSVYLSGQQFFNKTTFVIDN